MTTDVASECRIMNGEIEHSGGIDCMLVGIGLNGHIGFNEPGADISLEAHDQELHGSTLAS
jgi:6-phosphogluconolactonase/glucosamine-6-phosphate isomerase/deaminase